MGEIKNNIQQIEIKNLIPYCNNAKIHSEEQIKKIASSIREFGFLNPVIVDKDFNVIAGHGRIMAAKKLEMQTVPCLYVEGLTDAQRRAYILADNRIADFGQWDMELVNAELERIIEEDLNVDFLDFELPEELEEPTTKEDKIPEPPEEPRAKLGDLYMLGNHRLICGDSTDPLNIDILMDGKKADLVFTDPPYGMGKESNGVLNDNLNFDKLLEFNKEWIKLAFEKLKDNGSFYCWGIDEPLMDIYSNILKPMERENKITFRNLITWDKGNGLGQLSEQYRMYSIADEKCLFVIAGVQGFNNNSDNYFDGFEPIRAYLDAECKKCGGHKIWKKMLGNDMGKHYFTKSQWNFPTKEAYEKMQAFGKEYGAFGKEYEKIKKEYEEIKKEYEEIKKEWYETRAYFNNTHDNMNNVWHFDRTSAEERKLTGGHATPKPIALCARGIKSSSREGEIVLDFFGGSGSTLIACEQLNRTCYICELNPKYVDVIIKRWENLTGKKAQLI